MIQRNKLAKIIEIQIIIFCVFPAIAIIFYQYKPAHSYYYEEDFFSNFNGWVALIGFVFKIVFFWIILFFPILWLFQLMVLIKSKLLKKYYKQTLVLTIVYIISAFALFSLFAINNRQRFKERKDRLNSYIIQTQELEGDCFDRETVIPFDNLAKIERNTMFYKNINHHLK